jgi:hypothetical protein
LEAVHQLVHEIELAILETFDVAMVIHVDPVVQDNHRWLAFQAFIETTLHAMEKEASVHDFQLLTKTPVPMITFDIVVPYSYDEEAKGNLTTRLLEQIKIHYPTFLVTIHLETSFVDKEEE